MRLPWYMRAEWRGLQMVVTVNPWWVRWMLLRAVARALWCRVRGEQ